MASDSSDSNSHAPGPHRRRPRYRGTHPRRFEQRYKELQPEQYPDITDQVRSRGGTPAGTHVPILLAETMEILEPHPADVVADCTLGYGGHAAELLRRIGPTGRLVAFDLDRQELERTGQRLAGEFPSNRIDLHHANYAGLDKGLAGSNNEALAGYDIIFADLGVSSMQVDDTARGFTYKHDGPLDMRMDRERRRSAAELLAKMTEVGLAVALTELSDEPDAMEIARCIIGHRQHEPITRTRQLTQIVFQAKRLSPRNWREELAGRMGRVNDEGESTTRDPARLLHPAARTFQTLRILVNDELGSLAQLLRIVPYCLKPGGRIALISFHSGEDRLVKQSFATGLESHIYSQVASEPIRPAPGEQFNNPRSRSARLRWARRA